MEGTRKTETAAVTSKMCYAGLAVAIAGDFLQDTRSTLLVVFSGQTKTVQNYRNVHVVLVDADCHVN